MSLNARFAMTRSQTPILGPQGAVQKDWYILFYNIYLAVTEGLPQSEQAIEVTASPMTYQAVIRGQVHISGGTVSAVEYSRDGTTFYAVATSGFVQMDARDYLRVTYTVAPALNFFPM